MPCFFLGNGVLRLHHPGCRRDCGLSWPCWNGRIGYQGGDKSQPLRVGRAVLDQEDRTIISNLGFQDTDSIAIEKCRFSPSHDAVEHANITAYLRSKGFDNYEAFYQWSLEHRVEFWNDQARELDWFHTWDTTF